MHLAFHFKVTFANTHIQCLFAPLSPRKGLLQCTLLAGLYQVCFRVNLYCLHQNYYLAFISFLGPRCSDWGGGGLGITAAWPRRRATVLVGCAPTESQYCMRLMSRPICLFPSLPAQCGRFTQVTQSVTQAYWHSVKDDSQLLHAQTNKSLAHSTLILCIRFVQQCRCTWQCAAALAAVMGKAAKTENTQEGGKSTCHTWYRVVVAKYFDVLAVPGTS